ncbi:MAG: bifunctional adenosylcobinamide kinase/adenosylcobinamide-phosphate guanylyltransferase [Deltaproteobacteria bacterium]|jgi:adenosylcobinamide kinase/adenosylcobinamide-phosphate guanylyltransferase|nr:bifunctional adenosylcobinamide kinase/adenosylcobinamide-phosphate guanylyltransferase [Deltaproteobacteria bacterium]
MGELILYIGGAKSGKTKAALAKASTFPPPRLYLATAQGLDEEMLSRIRAHQAERGPEWHTLEVPFEPAAAVRTLTGRCPVLLDCVTLWFSNLLGKNANLALNLSYFAIKIEELIKASREYPGPLIVVSNELGGGIVPMDPVTRLYRDAVGQAHQLLAAAADSVFLVVAGIPLRLK